MDSAQFEALWQSANSQPVSTPTTQARPVAQVDLSLSSMLDRYLAMVGPYRDNGQVSQDDYNALAAAIADLKTILTRINDADLVKAAMTRSAQTRAAQTGGA
jgi:hypothetical protein